VKKGEVQEKNPTERKITQREKATKESRGVTTRLKLGESEGSVKVMRKKKKKVRWKGKELGKSPPSPERQREKKQGVTKKLK